ncbi:MAG: transposase domain-containing protein, partial [Polyangiales bacterium]
MRQWGPEHTFERLGKAIDSEWIEEALHGEETAKVRKRKLPREQAVWLVLGMAIFANHSIDWVMNRLELSIDGKPIRARSTASDARKRLGYEAMKRLFEIATRELGCKISETGTYVSGLRLYSIPDQLTAGVVFFFLPPPL